MDQILAEENVDNGADETVQWTLTDHLNTVRDIAKYDSQTGATTVVNHLIYDAFGKVTSESNPAVDSLFLFTARPFDAETGLQNNLNRWYDARVGRWLSEDPIGFAGGDGNLYRYVQNIAVLQRDPSGLIGMPWDTDSPSRALWEAIRKGQWDIARDTLDDILKYVADPKVRNSLQQLKSAINTIEHLDKWRNKMLKASYARRCQELRSLEKTLRKHLAQPYRQGVDTKETWIFRYQIDYLKQLLNQSY
ncbi:MAG: RHS repeat-associated core domain-containing protein [Anaerolineae bacterium]